jgi:putative membrane protein
MFKILCAVLIFGFFNLAQAQTTATQAPAGPTLSDPEIAKVLITINKGEIEAAKMAKKKAKNSEVKDFAKMMIKQHNENEAETKSIAKRNKMDLLESNMSKSLKEEAMAANKDLKKSDNFDKAYIDEQVNMHQKALTALNDTLIPQATNPDLKKHLLATQTAVNTHLEHAKKLQTTIQ